MARNQLREILPGVRRPRQRRERAQPVEGHDQGDGCDHAQHPDGELEEAGRAPEGHTLLEVGAGARDRRYHLGDGPAVSAEEAAGERAESDGDPAAHRQRQPQLSDEEGGYRPRARRRRAESTQGMSLATTSLVSSVSLGSSMYE